MENEMTTCPVCGGDGKGAILQGVQLSCVACMGKKEIRNDPFWIRYYTKQFGSRDGIQMTLKLEGVPNG
jgi:DnaJ-class molecular chaperone